MSVLNVQILDDVVRRLKAVFHPEVIYLFGSHAWGSPNEDSDLDLMVVVAESKLCRPERGRLASKSLRGVPAPVDVLVRTRSEFEQYRQVHSSLEREIAERGRRVYG